MFRLAFAMSPAPRRLFKVFSAGIFALLLGLVAPCLAGPLRLGINNGLANDSQLQMNNAAQAIADLISRATGQQTFWAAHFDGSAKGGHREDFAFVKPPLLTAKLLAQGWQLVAVARDSIGFGTDLIAPACPGKPGQVQLGGSSLSVLGLPANRPAVCVPISQVWKSPAVVLLSPKAGSPVDRVAHQMWRKHGPLPTVVHVDTQNAVAGLMRDMGVKAVGVVTPLVSHRWVAEGGVILAHEPMPFWAMLAAPDTPASLVDKVRGALLSDASAEVDARLKIAGWQLGSAGEYAAFAQSLQAR